jgi:hypothetical protein
MSDTEYDVQIDEHTTLAVYKDDDDEKWTVTGDLRAPGTGYDDEANYDCRDDLRDQLAFVEWDPESSQFFAYTNTAEEASALANAIKGWVLERRS